MANNSDSDIDLSKETVDLSAKGEKEPKSSSGSGSMPILDAGSEFAGYQIIRKIAHGAMGVVYLAEDPRLRRKVALKVILTGPGMQATDDQVSRFLREAQSIAKLRHKRIVPVYEVNTFENCHYFTMEYIEGPTLEQYLLKNEITAAKAIEIVLAIAEGLQEAHEKGVVHRDIKPANIIMQNGESPMITDFGLAKILEHEQKITMTGSMLGTPCYMSPEQARGDSDLDYRSDIFSLGVLLYEMITEKLPFKGESYMKTILIVINGDYIPPRKIKPRLSRDVESIIKKALEKDRDFRYESMVDFIDDCTRFQRGEVVTISRSGIYRKIFRNVVKQRNSIIMSVVIVLIIGYLMYKNIDQSLMVTEQLEDKARAQMQASREKEFISKKNKELELQGELLKKGTTSPEFTERFDNSKYFNDNWLTTFPLKIEKNTAELPSGKILLISPTRAEGFSSSAIFGWKMKIPVGNKFVFYCGKSLAADGKNIEKPIIVVFQSIKSGALPDGKQDRENNHKLKISFYQTPVKTIVDRTNFNAMDLLASMFPLAVKICDLPENVNESLYFSIKRHETFYEISIKEKEGVQAIYDKSFSEIFRVSSAAFLNPSPLQFGFLIPASNKASMNLEKIRVDKWITGTSEIEINRIVESYGRNDFKQLFLILQKHQEQLEKAWYITENQAEATNLKYQLAKTSFLMGISYHRHLTYQTSKEDIKLITDSYDKAFNYTKEYFSNNSKSTKTEYLNFEDLYLSVLVQIAFLNIFQGDISKANDLIKKHREFTEDNTPYNNWLWNLPDPLEKLISQTKLANKAKLGEKYNELFLFLRQLSFISEAGEASDIKRFLKDMLKNCVELNELELFDKFNSLTIDESNKLFLQEIITKEIAKEKINSLLILNTLKASNKIFKTEESVFVGNFKYEKWSTVYPERETRTWAEHIESLKNNQKENSLFVRATQLYPEFASAINPNPELTFEKLNTLVNNEVFRKKVITNLLDNLLIENRQKANGGLQELGAIFPVDLNLEQNRGGNINLTLEDDGLRISLITKDFELKNKYSGNMLSQQDCWELYFDFRHEHQFLSNQDGPGVFKLSYVPAPNENGKARIYFDESIIAPKFEVLSFINPANRNLPQNEVILFLPLSEIIRITNNPNIRYFGFNAILNLESKEKSAYKILFNDFHKKIFYLTKRSGNSSNEPLLTDKDLINELVNVYQQYGDGYSDKIMVKKIIDNWLNLSPCKPLVNDYQLKNIVDDFQLVMNENIKKMQVKKAIDDANLFYAVNGIVFGGRGPLHGKDSIVKNVIDKVINVLDLNLSSLDKKNKAATLDGEAFVEEVKRARQLMKYADSNGRKNYWRFLEKLLFYLKENQPEVYENLHNFLTQSPESEANFREIAISYMVRGMVSETLFYLRRHLESELWKDDERVWLEYQLISKIGSIMGVEIKISEEEIKDKSSFFNALSLKTKNIDMDLAFVFEKKMALKEFIAKYPLAESYIAMAKTVIADSSPIKKADEIRAGYEMGLKAVTAPWVSVMLKKRLADLQK